MSTKLTALTELSAPTLDDLTYVVDDPGGSPASRKLTLTRLGGLLLAPMIQGRLTTETGVAVSTSDRTAQGTLYFTPYQGNRVAVYDGTRWNLYTFTELSLALTATSGKNYDVFLYDNSGTLTLELSAAWASDTARTDALTTQDGVWVKSGATTRRYLGTIRASGTNTTEDSAAKRFVWNVQHRVARRLSYCDTTDSWSFNSVATWRQANSSAAAQVAWICGLAEDAVPVTLQANGDSYTASGLKVAIGLDSVSTATTRGEFGTTEKMVVTIGWVVPPALGYHYAAWLELSASPGGNSTVYGDNNEEPQSFLTGVVQG